ncbi:larval/pupal cuticle protein H1C-like [Toxorhynchites rutilus septentrionalis]|uniref:larval/pupal cuticle protein H1C-like n=1 Tax=Toxorhynchites rutilus septentrionalis TaxID=329112 RepID=UPI0024796062|nr:larval/pupal cuticle protein H1C-like [Toxorhynchites rutilus septentrionalis]
MAFKFVVFVASLAFASAGYLEAPVAHYSSAPSVSYSTISQPAPLAKTVAYAAPAAYASYAHAAPLAYAAPITKTLSYSAPAVGATHESTIRSHDATVSHYSKAVDTPYSSVRKSDIRVTNEAPKLALASYAHAPAIATYSHAPVVAKQVSYAAPALTTYSHSAPVALTKQVSYAAPAVATYAHAAPAIASYSHAAPAIASYSHAAPAYTSYAHAAPAIATYAHAAPAIAAHSTKTLTYSPAVEVAHVSYDGSHAHYGW